MLRNFLEFFSFWVEMFKVNYPFCNALNKYWDIFSQLVWSHCLGHFANQNRATAVVAGSIRGDVPLRVLSPYLIKKACFVGCLIVPKVTLTVLADTKLQGQAHSGRVLGLPLVRWPNDKKSPSI